MCILTIIFLVLVSAVAQTLAEKPEWAALFLPTRKRK
jgi:hypothetical protein